MLPGFGEFFNDVRTTPGMTFEQFDEDLRAALRRCEPELGGATYELSYPPHLRWMQPTEVSSDHPMVQASLRASAQVLGRPMERRSLLAAPTPTRSRVWRGKSTRWRDSDRPVTPRARTERVGERDKYQTGNANVCIDRVRLLRRLTGKRRSQFADACL